MIGTLVLRDIQMPDVAQSNSVPLGASRRANVLGSFWMVFAMACFAVEDVFIKLTAGALPLGEVLILFGGGGALMFAALAMARGESLFPADVVSRPMRIRVCFEIMGRLFYSIAIVLTPLSAATVILQATPLVVVASAAVIFGETVGWRRWSAILIGLIGVVVIIRPGGDSFSALSILAILGMIGFAGRDLASRAAPAALSVRILGVYGYLAIVVAGGIFALWDGAAFLWPDLMGGLYLLGAIVCGVVAYSALMNAMRTGDVSAVTPFRYTRLLFGLAFGVILFGEALDGVMLLGCALIVLSGLFILWRGKRS